MAKQPNLLFILSDNHNRSVLGCHGHPIVQTPALDALAARGARMEAAYTASSLCVPARASVATGRYPHQTGYWDNVIAYDGQVPSWMHRLREGGYRTASIGKLHYRSTDDDNGFDEEIVPLHIVDGVGGLVGLLRWNEPPKIGFFNLYDKKSGVGETEYQEYDRKITAEATRWMDAHADDEQPWALFVGYVSSHPPFLVPQRFFDMYPPERMPLPRAFRPGERPEHPAIQHLRSVYHYERELDEELCRRMAAGYFGLVTHLDEQIGQVLRHVEAKGLLERTTVVYTSDHGENFGHLGLVGKSQLYEDAVGVPLLMAGPGIPAGRVVSQLTSHVDLFPTLLEAAGLPLAAADADLPGISLWPALRGQEQPRSVFAEYHAACSKNAMFLWREGAHKLIYHVDFPNQVFDLAADPGELNDLHGTPAGDAIEQPLEARLRGLLDPEAVDARAKADQRKHVEKNGGEQAIRDRGYFPFSPAPGHKADYQGQGR